MAILFGAAAPALADAQAQVQAARKAERRGEWKRALEEWKAAYAAEVNAEYLIGIADCHAKLGNTAEAKKNYSAYLADPLALPANVEKVKARLAALDSPGAALALPGGGLTLPGAAPSAAAPLPVDLDGSIASEDKGGRKGKQKKGNEAAPLPGLELPGAAPAKVAKNDAGVLALPGLELPAAPPSKKEPERKVAATTSPLTLPGLPLPSQTTSKTEKKEPSALLGGTPAKPISTLNTPGQQIAMNTASGTASQKPDRHVPDAVIADTPRRSPAEASGANRTVAFVAAGVAVAALGGGAFAFTKAGSAHSELTGKIHDGATAQSLLETEAKNKTLSFVGLAGGLVAAGIATALFAF